MTKNIVIVPGSVRKNSVAEKVVALAKTELEKNDDIVVTVANLKEMNLPFFDNENMPSHPEFSESNEQVQTWTHLIDTADGVLFITPEYNRNMSAIQKNAIDWIYKEWEDKPVATINYGYSGGQKSLEGLTAALTNVKANFLPAKTQLFFMKDLNPDGSAIDSEAVRAKISHTISELITTL